jgi:hypothetical protein
MNNFNLTDKELNELLEKADHNGSTTIGQFKLRSIIHEVKALRDILKTIQIVHGARMECPCVDLVNSVCPTGIGE